MVKLVNWANFCNFAIGNFVIEISFLKFAIFNEGRCTFMSSATTTSFSQQIIGGKLLLVLI